MQIWTVYDISECGNELLLKYVDTHKEFGSRWCLTVTIRVYKQSLVHTKIKHLN